MTESLKANVLFTDGTESNIDLYTRSASVDDLMVACTALRRDEPRVAEVKVSVPGFDAPYVWAGHYTSEHMAAIAQRERASMAS